MHPKLGLYPPLATGKCESCQHIKGKKDHALGGKHCFFAATGGQANELDGQLPPSFCFKRGHDVPPLPINVLTHLLILASVIEF